MAAKHKNPLWIVACISLLLAGLKFLAFAATGSLIVLSSALDSSADSVVSYINYRIHLFARKKADQEHPYGHGGFEVISSLIQAVVLVLGGLIIMYKGGQRLLQDSVSRLDFQYVVPAAAVLGVSAFAGVAIQWYLHRFEQRLSQSAELSLSVTADRAHYLGDFFMNLASAAALLIVWWTGVEAIDSLAAIIGGAILIKVAIPILKGAFAHITHQEAEPALQKKIVAMVLGSDSRVRNLHRFRTRRLGPTIFIDFHLKIDRNLSLQDSHKIAETIEKLILKSYPQADITIHIDPDDEPQHAGYLPTYNKSNDDRRDK